VRPVNLIPPEDRRGSQAPLRTGPAVYILVGALVTVLLAVTAMVLVDNQIAEREAEVAKLEREDEAASAKAASLAAYTQFQTTSEQRAETVRSLADSRFDWERVMRELSLVLPGDVTLDSLEASAGGDAGIGSGELSGSGGPALSLSGCATGQEGVAEFVTALKDIDGVTRVGVKSSTLAESGGGAETTAVGAATSSGEGCARGGPEATFEMLVTFDAAPVPSESTEGETAPAPEASSEENEEGS